MIKSSITTTHEAFSYLQNHYNPDVEEFWGIFLNNHLEILNAKLLHRGTVNYCTVHPRDLFREAIRHNSSAIIIAHNHPSGHLEPSKSDIILTKKMLKIGKLLEIPILDHIIFTNENFYSLKQFSRL